MTASKQVWLYYSAHQKPSQLCSTALANTTAASDCQTTSGHNSMEISLRKG